MTGANNNGGLSDEAASLLGRHKQLSLPEIDQRCAMEVMDRTMLFGRGSSAILRSTVALPSHTDRFRDNIIEPKRTRLGRITVYRGCSLEGCQVQCEVTLNRTAESVIDDVIDPIGLGSKCLEYADGLPIFTQSEYDIRPKADKDGIAYPAEGIGRIITIRSDVRG